MTDNQNNRKNLIWNELRTYKYIETTHDLFISY